MEQNLMIATQWIMLALIASLLSIRLGIALALMEIIVGLFAGNIVHIEITPWVNYLAGFGAVALTFLAGAEIDPDNLKQNLKENLTIGFLSFLPPFLVSMACAYYIFGWDLNASKIAGIALSTTSVAVVFAVMVESGLSSCRLGQTILASCFITDLGTVVALGILFTGFSLKLVIFILILTLTIAFASKLASRLFAAYGGRVSEPEIKFIFLLLAGIGYLALTSGSEAVLPAYILGMAMAGFFSRYKETLHKMRAVVFVSFTPFYFIKAGALISWTALYSTATSILLLLVLQVWANFLGVLPATYAFKYDRRTGIYITLLMSTGLTFGTISSLYGLTNNYINSSQYSILVAVVILNSIVPSIIAQRYFFPLHHASNAESAKSVDLQLEKPSETNC